MSVRHLPRALRRLAVPALLLAGALATHPKPALALTASDRAVYAQAFIAADREQWSAALDTAAQAADPTLREVIAWEWLQQPNSGASFATLADFIARHPEWPAQGTLRRRAEEALTGQEDARALLAWFAANPPFTGRGKMFYAEALEDTGQSAASLEVARNAWINESLGRLEEKRFLDRFGRHLGPDLHFQRASTLLWDGDAEGARRLLPFLSAGHSALIEARLALQAKAKTVEGLVAAVPASLQHDPGLLYDRMRFRLSKDMIDEAADMLKLPGANQVRPRKWWKERATLARKYLERGWVSRAYDIASHHGQTDGSGFAEAEWLSGWIALRFLKDSRTALAHFTRMHDGVTTPISLGRAAYWAGRAAESAGDQGKARIWYAQAGDQVTTYYGQLAAERLGQRPTTLPPPPVITAEDKAAFERAPLVAVVRALEEIGRDDDARPFLIRLAEDLPTPGQQALAVQLARAGGRIDAGVAIARRLANRGFHLIDAAYPLPDFSVPQVPERALVLSLIRQESNFQRTAVSRVGARGLMQLMPATAKQVAKGLGVTHSDADLIADPAYNVRLGSTYLAEMLDRFNGSYAMAVAAYNAGPGRPAKWMREFGDPRKGEIDVIDWVEMIPFTETRNYVQRVLEGLQVYRHRLGNSELAFSLANDLRR